MDREINLNELKLERLVEQYYSLPIDMQSKFDRITKERNDVLTREARIQLLVELTKAPDSVLSTDYIKKMLGI